MFTCVHKHYSPDAWKEFAAANPEVLPHVAASSGMARGDLEKLKLILEAVPQVSSVISSDILIRKIVCGLGLMSRYTVLSRI